MYIVGFICVIHMLRQSKRRDEQMRKNPSVKYIVEIAPNKTNGLHS